MQCNSNSYLPFFCLLIAAACGGNTDAVSGSSVVDSAGVQIVTSHTSQWSTGNAWQVSDTPLVRAGVNESRPEEAFGRVITALRLTDGQLVIAVDGEVRWFDSSGRFIKTATRRGDGPGEFRTIAALYRLDGDRVLVDAGVRSALLDASGSLLSEERFDCQKFRELRGPLPCALPQLPDGTRLMMLGDTTISLGENAGSAAASSQSSGTHRDFYRFHIVPPSLDTAYATGIGGGMETYPVVLPGGRSTTLIHPFLTRRSFWATGGSPMLLAIATNPEYEIEVWSTTGKLERVIRRSGAMIAPSAEMIAEAPTMVASQEPEIPAEFFANAVPTPAVLPAVQSMWMETHGTLWVQRSGRVAGELDQLYDVFNKQGIWLGELRLPMHSRLLHVDGKYLVLAIEQPAEAPIVAVWQLLRR